MVSGRTRERQRKIQTMNIKTNDMGGGLNLRFSFQKKAFKKIT